MGKSKIAIIIAREYAVRVKKKSFILTTILTPLLFAALMGVPTLIAMYSGNEEGRVIKVVDESGIVMPYLESNNELTFEQVEGETLASLKENFKTLDAFAILGITPLDSNKNVSITAYSEKQMNMDLQSRICKYAKKAVEDSKLKAYNIPDLDKVLADIKSDVKINTFTIDESTGEEKASKVEIYMVIGYVASFMIYMFVFMFGNMVMRSVIEEKTTRIVEVIVSSVKPFQLMLGKILGVAAVGLTQFLIWIVLTLAIVIGFTAIAGGDAVKGTVTEQQAQMAALTGVDGEQISQMVPGGVMPVESGVPASSDIQEEDGVAGYLQALKNVNYVQIVVCFLIYFLLGYLLYSGMFAAVGSAVDNEADTQQLILPITMPLIIGLFIMLHTFQYPDSPLSFWGSIIPFTSPMVMMARIAYGVPAWELALSIGLLIVTFLALTYISGKIYRIGILMYGKKASWKDLMKWMRYKN